MLKTHVVSLILDSAGVEWLISGVDFSDFSRFKDRLKSALLISLEDTQPQIRQVRGRTQAEASVLLLWGVGEQGICVLMTRRTDQTPTHKGQYAFPGGMLEAGESFSHAALRETEEEMGIQAEEVEVLGELPGFLIPTSRFWVVPVLGVLPRPLEEVTIVPSEIEIDDWFWAPWERFEDPSIHRKEDFVNHRGESYEVDVYQLDEHRIWGATAYMIRSLVERMDRLEKL